mmetsp:Transcript_20062/g.26139  ORF Transcript_20062/g.26139 Transcript_20062/m.26139 type:complete len:145 (+) Transcript_20062:97-531(+)
MKRKNSFDNSDRTETENESDPVSNHALKVNRILTPIEESVADQECIQKRGRWSADEVSKLINLIKLHGTDNWDVIVSHHKSRNEQQCKNRWALINSINKLKWTLEEDRLLLNMSKVDTPNFWVTMSKRFPGRYNIMGDVNRMNI